MSARDNSTIERFPIRSVVSSQPPVDSASNQGRRDFFVKLQHLCKPSYRWRWFRSKGVAIVLVWNFAAFAALNYLYKLRVSNRDYGNRYRYLVVISAGAVFFPAVGWLADVWIGRYRVIKSCLGLMWVGAILTCATYTAERYMPDVAFVVLIICSGILLGCGIGAFLVNIIQFSIDQLIDSSSVEIVSFINWYVWTYFASKLVNEILVCSKRFHQEVFPVLFVCILLTVSVALDFLFNHWLVKEPVEHNPLRLIFSVLCYAMKNKYPRKRIYSWDSTRYSRLDVAKNKYGGPFTTKEVEDVKTLFLMLSVVSLGCFYIAMFLYSGSEIYVNSSNFYRPKVKVQSGNCLRKVSIIHLGYLLLSLCIPFYEIVILPVFWKCLPQLRIFTRMALGGAILFLSLLTLVSMEVVGKFRSCDSPVNGTDYCPDMTPHDLPCGPSQESSYYWLAALSSVAAIGQCLTLVAGVEFVCSQTPYSMKGLMFGLVYSIIGLSVALVYLLFLPFKLTVISVKGTVMGCVFWFLLSCSFLALLVCVAFSIASYCYKNRKKDDDY